jgi:hypothetical protein
VCVIRKCVRLPVEGREKKEETMRAVTVYRMDYGRRTKSPIGVVLENRKTERTNNYNDLLRLARRLFASDTADSVHIVIDVSQARQAYMPERTRDYSAEAAVIFRPGDGRINQ